MQRAHDGGSLEMLLREEVEARPVVAYRLLELLARTGWAVRIDRGSQTRIEAVRGSTTLCSAGATVGEAAVPLFVQAASLASSDGSCARRGGNGRRAA